MPATLTELTVIAAKRYRAQVAERLCYLTDGLTLPKMHDGTNLVNWGIYRPDTAPVAAVSSTGAVSLDTCESLWTPASLLLDDCEDAWTLSSLLDENAEALCLTSADAKVGSLSALALIGTLVEPIDGYTKLYLKMNGVDGSTTFLDSASGAKAVTAVGNAQIDTDQFKFGTGSCLLDGTGDWLTLASHADWSFGTGDFRIGVFARFSALGAIQADLFDTGTFGVCLRAANLAADQWRLLVNNAFVDGGAFSLGVTATNTWYYIEVNRTGTDLRVSVNGVSKLSVVNSDSVASSGTFYIGSSGAATPIAGWLDDFRVDKGVSRHATFPFIPPASEAGDFVALQNDPEGITGILATEDLSAPQDLSTYWGLQFWVRSAKSLAAGDVSLVICDSTAGAAELERCSIPALLAGEWTKVEYQFQTASSLTSVASLALAINRDKGMNAIYLDDIRATRCRVTLDSTQRVEGNYSVKLEIPGGVPASTVVAYNTTTLTDMSADTAILMNLRADKFLGYQMFQYLLDDSPAVASPLESLYITADLAADTWHQLSLVLAAPAGDTAIISHGLKVVNRSVAPVTIWLDDIRRATSVAGNLTGRYYAWVAFYATKYDRESDLSPISNVADAQGQSINLTSIPVSTDTQVDARRIYRSQAGGTVPYLEKTINDNTTTTVALTLSDASLGLKRRHPSGEEGAGSYSPPYASPYLIGYRNTIIMGGSIPYTLGTVNVQNGSATVTMNAPGVVNRSMEGKELRVVGDTQIYLVESVNTAGNTLVIRPIDNLVSGVYKGSNNAVAVYQIIGDENALHTSFIDDDNVTRPHGFPAELVQTVTQGKAGDKITGLGLTSDAFLVCKRFSTHLGEGTYAPWTMSQISDAIGCAANDTMVQDEKGQALWLAGEQGVALCDGFTVTLISDILLNLFDGTHDLGFNTAKYENAHAVYDTQKHWLWLFLTSKTATENDVVLILDRSNANPERWKWYYFTGINAKSSTIVYDDNGIATIYIGDYDGFISTLNVGYNDGVQSGTLSGTPTGGTPITLVDTGASFYTTGSGLKAMSLVLYDTINKSFEQRKILSNTGTIITIENTAGWVERAARAGGTEQYIAAMIEFNGKLYGTSAQNGSLWEWSGTAWVVKAPKLGGASGVMCLCIYNNELYGGTSPFSYLYKWNGVNAWVQVAPSFPGEAVYGVVVLNNKIYGATTGGRLLEWDGVNNWIERAPSPAIGTSCTCLTLFNGKLYTFGDPNAKLYEWDGVSAWVAKTGSIGSCTGWTLCEFNGKLYGGVGWAGGAQLYEWNGVNAWVLRAGTLAGQSQTRVLIVYRGNLYGGFNGTGKLARWNGISAWVEAAGQPGTETSLYGSAVFNNKLYVGTSPTAKLYEYDVSSGFAVNPSSLYRYYIGSYELDWKSKNYQFARATDKNMVHDLFINHQDATASQNIRVRLYKNLGKEVIANQEIDMTSGEEAVLLVRQRVQQGQVRINGYSQGQAIEINTLGLRFKKRGVR